MVQGHLDFLRFINMTGFQSVYQFIGRQIDINHFIGFLKHTVGHSFFHFNPRNLLHFFIHTLDMLDIDCTDDIDPCIQQFENILPPLFVFTSFNIGMGQFIDNYDFGM